MTVLYIGYWPCNDPLTTAVINPRLQILAKMDDIAKIYFCSFERGTKATVNSPIPKVEYVHYSSDQKKNIFLTKFSDFTSWPAFLESLVTTNRIDLVIGNSPFAGGAAYLIWRKSKIPFIVECFEPHADSMFESGVWKRLDIRYLVLKFLESKQKKNAWRLQVVSTHFANKLLKEGVSAQKIHMLANCLNIETFAFNMEQRTQVRAQLGFSKSDLIGIYVGKFGGIYYEKEAFELFAHAFHFFGDSFRLIILTSNSVHEVSNHLIDQDVDISKVFVSSVPHHQVMHYLSAADFAFATIKATPIRLYCCPVKNGEYWANGLPILLEDGIGDDSEIIKNEGGGFILNRTNGDESLEKMKNYLFTMERAQISSQIQPIATKYRRLDLITEYYKGMIGQFKASHLPIPFLVYKLIEILM